MPKKQKSQDEIIATGKAAGELPQVIHDAMDNIKDDLQGKWLNSQGWRCCTQGTTMESTPSNRHD